MATYCTVNDVRQILPDQVNVGTDKTQPRINVSVTEVENWIEFASDEIESYLSTYMKTPLSQYKEPDFSVTPITFTEKYPPPIPLICARIAAGHIYDEVMMAQQEPNISEWGKNQRSWGYENLERMKAGQILLRGQEFIGMRFVRQELRDSPRMPWPDAMQTPNRGSGE